MRICPGIEQALNAHVVATTRRPHQRRRSIRRECVGDSTATQQLSDNLFATATRSEVQCRTTVLCTARRDGDVRSECNENAITIATLRCGKEAVLGRRVGARQRISFALGALT
tara:strand:+ start:287 stop:625 length:339 start_codon:yes stop_codon:yes gene_type:complete